MLLRGGWGALKHWVGHGTNLESMSSELGRVNFDFFLKTRVVGALMKHVAERKGNPKNDQKTTKHPKNDPSI